MSTLTADPIEDAPAGTEERPSRGLDYANPGLPKSHLAPSERLVSLDALRGFDMFWILGADVLVRAIADAVTKSGHSVKWLQVAHEQVDHVPWEGFHFYDFIFPLFVFIVGVSSVFSLTKIIANSGKSAAVKRIIIRSVILYLLGIFYHGGLANYWWQIRFVGVLHRIAICYLVAGLLFTFFRPRTLAIVAGSLLLLYWGLMALVPVPGVGRGNYAEGMNLANYIDRKILIGRKWDGDHDPEGLLSTLPAIATCLCGVFAGLLMRDPAVRPWKKIAILVLAGVMGVAAGMAWGGMLPGGRLPESIKSTLLKLRFPVIKKLWTSSFVLLTAGWGCIALALFYLVVDVWKLRLWARPFVWIGMNAITLYLLKNLFPFRPVANRLVGGHVADALGVWATPVEAAVALLLVVLLARFLYRRKIFLRL
jgi:predicted acyltransferase